MTDPQPIQTDIVLLTSRLRLSTPRMSDAMETADAMTVGIHQWMLTWPFPMWRADAEQRIAKCLAEVGMGEALHFVLRARESDQFIGWTSSWRSDRGRWRIGLWIAEPHQGRTLGREAASTVLRWTENLVQPEAVDAAVSPDNARSIAMLRRLGMIEVGTEQFFIPGANGLRRHLIMEKPFQAPGSAEVDRASAA